MVEAPLDRVEDELAAGVVVVVGTVESVDMPLVDAIEEADVALELAGELLADSAVALGVVDAAVTVAGSVEGALALLADGGDVVVDSVDPVDEVALVC